MSSSAFPDPMTLSRSLEQIALTDNGNDGPLQRGWRFQLGGSKLGKHRQAKFEGRWNDLQGHIYDYIDSSHTGQYMRATKEIVICVGWTFKFGMDTRLIIENLEPWVLTVEEDPPEDSSQTNLRTWETHWWLRPAWNFTLREHQDRILNDLGSTTDLMWQNIQASHNFASISATGDAIELLQII